MRTRRAENTPGPLWVDDACIDCDGCRQLAPTVFADVGGQSAVAVQPTEGRVEDAWRAVHFCPVGAIHLDGPKPAVPTPFPHPIDGPVSLLGYAAEHSYGANSFLVEDPAGNVMVDGPRWVPRLVRELERRGGLAHVLLTHRDDVADAERYARHFGARVWIHRADARAAPFATDLLDTDGPIFAGWRVCVLPGHTRGSVAWLYQDTWLFTGDSLCYSRARDDLHAFRDACWYSWEEQALSLRKLADLRFRWVLAGHGDRRSYPEDEMRARVLALVDRMQGASRGGGRFGTW